MMRFVTEGYHHVKKSNSRKYRYILALDPSGSFYEGKGTTGWCLFDTVKNKFINCGSLYAKDYNSMEAYWQAVIDLIKQNFLSNTIIVCEDYLLYANKLQNQINSRMETPKLIGCLQLFCYQYNLPYRMQTASEVKTRWANHILEHKGYIELINKRGEYRPTSGKCETYSHHSLDAIRHAIHYAIFKNN